MIGKIKVSPTENKNGYRLNLSTNCKSLIIDEIYHFDIGNFSDNVLSENSVIDGLLSHATENVKTLIYRSKTMAKARRGCNNWCAYWNIQNGDVSFDIFEEKNHESNDENKTFKSYNLHREKPYILPKKTNDNQVSWGEWVNNHVVDIGFWMDDDALHYGLPVIIYVDGVWKNANTHELIKMITNGIISEEDTKILDVEKALKFNDCVNRGRNFFKFS